MKGPERASRPGSWAGVRRLDTPGAPTLDVSGSARALSRAGRGTGAVAQLGERRVRNAKVRGSIPLCSTTLRALCALRLGKPASCPPRATSWQASIAKTAAPKPRRGEGGLDRDEVCLHLAKRCRSGAVLRRNSTDDLRARVRSHNAGQVAHTSKHKPWKVITYMAFSDESRAFAFEKYLKTASGRAFAKKRL